MIINKLENELKELKSMQSFKTYSDFNSCNEKINNLEKQIAIMKSISNVINKKIQRGADTTVIQNYKQELLTNVWRNNELVKRHILEIS